MTTFLILTIINTNQYFENYKQYILQQFKKKGQKMDIIH